MCGEFEGPIKQTIVDVALVGVVSLSCPGKLSSSNAQKSHQKTPENSRIFQILEKPGSNTKIDYRNRFSRILQIPENSGEFRSFFMATQFNTVPEVHGNHTPMNLQELVNMEDKAPLGGHRLFDKGFGGLYRLPRFLDSFKGLLVEHSILSWTYSINKI
jgi:hypothetical protein